MGETAIEFVDVTYTYPDGHTALKAVNLKVLRGERVAILGPNGAGKSTLLMLTNGLFTPSKGQVYVLSMPLNKENLYKIRRKVGLVFQNPEDQLFCPTLWEDVTFGPLNMDLPEDEVARRAKEALKAVGLDGYEDKAPHHLSVGEKKRAAVATVLAMEPEILVLDEPTANLDPKSRRELMGIINKLYREKKVTLIMATHDVNFVPLISEKIYILNRGRIIAEGSVREVFSNLKLMSEASLEPPIITHLFSLLKEQNEIDAEEYLPLTIEEALQRIKRLMGKTKS